MNAGIKNKAGLALFCWEQIERPGCQNKNVSLVLSLHFDERSISCPTLLRLKLRVSFLSFTIFFTSSYTFNCRIYDDDWIFYYILDAEKETVGVIGSSSSEVAYSELRCNEKIQEKEEEDCQFGQEAQGSSQKTTCLTEPTDSIDREMPDLTPTASDLSEVTGNLLSVFSI